MAIVPVAKPEDIVAPIESPSVAKANDYQKIAVDGASFGNTTALAFANFGKDLESTGQGLGAQAVAAAELNNETTARDASTKAMADIATTAADFFSKKGQNAVDAYPQFMSTLQSMNKDTVDGMTNPSARNMLGHAMAPVMRHYTEAAANHLKSEQVSSSILSSTSRVSALTDQAAMFRNDPNKVEDYIAGVAGEMRNLAQIQGWDAATLDDKTRKVTGDAYRKVIEGLAVDNPAAAQSMFVRVRDKLDANDALKISEFLKPKVEKAGDEAWLASNVSYTGSLPRNVNPDKLWDAQTYQESHNQQFDKSGAPLTSRAGAVGASQIMPDTAMDMGKSLGVKLDTQEEKDAFMKRVGSDEGYNRTLGKAYMSRMLATYGDPTLALAAYNAGPGRVDGWLKSIGDPRTGAISTEDWIAKIPFDETRGYVRNITNAVGSDLGTGTLQHPPREDLIKQALNSSGDLETQLRRLTLANRYIGLLDHRDTQARADLTHEIENNIAPALHQGQEGIEIPESRIRTTFPKEQAETMIANLKYTQMSGQMFKSVAMASPDELQSIRDDLISGQGIMSGMLKGKSALLGGTGAPVNGRLAEADSALGLTPQEKFLYQTHLNNLQGNGKIVQPNGAVSSLLQMSFEQDGKTYNIPTVWGGKQLSADASIAEAKKIGLDKFPAYGSTAEAEARYGKMHDFIEKDTTDYLDSQSGGPQADVRLRQQMAQELQARVQQRQEALRTDPASYVASNDPAVRANLQAVIAGTDPNALQAYATATLASQARLGVPEGRQLLLPLSYIDTLANKFKTEDPSKDDPGLAIQSMAQQWGTFWPKVYGELVTKGKLPDEAAITAVLDAPGQAQVRQDYVRAWQAAGKRGEQKLEDAIDPSIKGDINKGIDSQLSDFRATILVPGISAAQNVEAYTQFRNGVKLLASYYALQGETDGARAVKKAIDGMVGAKWDLAETFRTPKGMVSQTENAMSQVERGLTIDNVRDPGAEAGSKEAALDPKKRTELWLGGKKLWVNNEAGDGVVMRVQARDGSVMPIYNQAGQRIELKFSDIAKSPAAPITPTPSAVGLTGIP